MVDKVMLVEKIYYEDLHKQIKLVKKHSKIADCLPVAFRDGHVNIFNVIHIFEDKNWTSMNFK